MGILHVGSRVLLPYREIVPVTPSPDHHDMMNRVHDVVKNILLSAQLAYAIITHPCLILYPLLPLVLAAS